jgi:hypothetical protein
MRHEISHGSFVASLGIDEGVLQFKINVGTPSLVFATTSLNGPIRRWKLVLAHLKKFLLQKKKFFGILREVDPL